MTDGTSQGLFIVVAIVIFGIFVVLAYILFEDTLSPALATMFADATEQAEHRLSNKNDEKDFIFDGNTQTITSYVGTSKRVSIPDTIAGVPVLHIAPYAFNRDTFGTYSNLIHQVIHTVVIPDTVLTIGDRAFDGQPISSLKLGNSVELIDWAAFNDFNGTTLVLPNSLKIIGSHSFGDARVKHLEIPSSVETIESYAFQRANLTHVEVPSHTTVQKYAFPDTTSIIRK